MKIDIKLFEEVKRLCLEYKKKSHKLDKQIEEKFGFHYSDFDMDNVIDTLDYGTDNISFNDFIKLMEEQKVLNSL